MVHNGIIENYATLKERLLAEGHRFRSETDTEVIAHLLEEQLRAGHDLREACRATLAELRGAYAIAVLSSAHPDEMVAAKLGAGSVVVGLGRDETYLASDIPAILPYTREVVILEDGEVARITRAGLELMVVFKVSVTWTVLWVPVLLVVQVLFTFALVCLTSAVHVYFRDIGHALTLGLQLWMFATPVAYPMSVVPEAVRPLYVLNPMAPLIDGYRRAIVYGESPDLARIGIVLVVVLVLMSFTYLGFKRAERTFADVI